MLNLNVPLVLPVVEATSVDPNHTGGRFIYTDIGDLLVSSDNSMNRSSYPFNHTVILSEGSRRTQQVIDLLDRRQTTDDYSETSIVAVSANPTTIRLRGKNGKYGSYFEVRSGASVSMEVSVWDADTKEPIAEPSTIYILYQDTPVISGTMNGFEITLSDPALRVIEGIQQEVRSVQIRSLTGQNIFAYFQITTIYA